MGLGEAPTANTPCLVRCEPSGETYNLDIRQRVLIAVQVADLAAVGF